MFTGVSTTRDTFLQTSILTSNIFIAGATKTKSNLIQQILGVRKKGQFKGHIITFSRRTFPPKHLLVKINVDIKHNNNSSGRGLDGRILKIIAAESTIHDTPIIHTLVHVLLP